ncbi:MAG: adenosine kinase [Spongiibacteraceae bacterium]|jgi:fructokinase|nr:adenosine kinase [Spongiibacteraceae bacterium]
MTHYHIYGIGAALVDTEIEVNDADLRRMAVDKGLMTLVDEARQAELLQHLDGHLVHSRRASGGSACNSIIAASYFGARTYYSCKVADDDHGRFYLDDLRRAGVDADFERALDAGITGKCLVLITPDAERSMSTFLGISETLSVRDLNPEAIARSQYLYVEGYQVSSDSGRAAAIHACDIARQHGVKIALSLSDPSMVQFFRAGLRDMIGSGVDLLFCNRDEALAWTGGDAIEGALEELKGIARHVVITRSADGALIFDGERVIDIPGRAVKAVDANGAGDMFAGAYLYALTQGRDAATAGQLANTAAGTVVTQYGPRLRPEQHGELVLGLKSLTSDV